MDHQDQEGAMSQVAFEAGKFSLLTNTWLTLQEDCLGYGHYAPHNQYHSGYF